VSFDRVKYCCFAVDISGGGYQGAGPFTCFGDMSNPAGDYSTRDQYLYGLYTINYRLQYAGLRLSPATYSPGGAPLAFMWTKRRGWYAPDYSLYIPLPEFASGGYTLTSDYGAWERGGGTTFTATPTGSGSNPDGLSIPFLGTGDSQPTWGSNGCDIEYKVFSNIQAGGGPAQCWYNTSGVPMGQSPYFYGVSGATHSQFLEIEETYYMAGPIIVYTIDGDHKFNFQCISSVFQSDQGPQPYGRLWFLAARTEDL
jgi:hypothetical protein